MPGFNADQGSGYKIVGTAPPQYATGGASSAGGYTTTTGGTGTYAMLGLGQTIKPLQTGKICVTLDGFAQMAVAAAVGAGLVYGLAYGTGTAPVNYGGLTGTVLGATSSFKYSVVPTSITNSDTPIGMDRVALGLVPGTTYWFDVYATNYIPADRVNILNPTINLLETP